MVLKPNSSKAGFVLPLALTASLLLLLGSASIHTLSLKHHLRWQAAFELEQAKDRLRSAAQAFAVMATGAQACLLLRPSSEWTTHQKTCAESEPSSLMQGSVGGQTWHLLAWHPGLTSGHLQLALANGRRGSFRLKLDADGLRVLAISDVQFQGLAPEVLS